MRQEAWDEVKIALYDYPKLDYYINQLRQEKLFPYLPNDDNSWIRGEGTNSDMVSRQVISINDDIVYKRLCFQREQIRRSLEQSPEWLRDLIGLMYLRSTRLKLKPASELVGKDYRAAKKGHEQFMTELAQSLGIITF